MAHAQELLLSTPTPTALTKSNLSQFIDTLPDRLQEEIGFASEDAYHRLHHWSITHLDSFWDAVWDFAGLVGEKGERVLSSTTEMFGTSFYPEGKINYTENIFRSCPQDPHKPALIARCQDQEDKIYSWADLKDQVSLWEQALTAEGVQKGDRVCAYMSNIPEAVFLLLACANLGIIFSSAGAEMGADDLINRFSQINPTLLIAANGYCHGKKNFDRLATIKKVQEHLPSVQKTILIPVISAESDQNAASLPHNACSVEEFLAPFTAKELQFTRHDFNHPLYILFSSGSTGKPKCFVHSQGGVLLKHVEEHLLQCDIQSEDRLFYHATPSWMMWNWLISGLAVGATLLLYDGSPSAPDATVQWKFCAEHRCTHHGTAAPLILNWAEQGLSIKDLFDLSDLRMVLSTGAVLPEQGFTYVAQEIKGNIPICSISGGSDIVGCFVGGNPFAATYAGQIHGPMLGMNIRILKETDGTEAAIGEAGELVCTTPFPSMPIGFWNDPEQDLYRQEYFSYYDMSPAIWRHGDAIFRTEEDQFVIVGRSDATLNQNGVRIGTTALYDQLAGLAGIADAAAINFTRPKDKQVITVLCLDLQNHPNDVPPDLASQIKTKIKDNVTPYAIPAEMISVSGILKTPNGKKAELVMSKILNGKKIRHPALYGHELVDEFKQLGQSLRDKYRPDA